jgi:Ca2+-binding EF-hand superfamily protein
VVTVLRRSLCRCAGRTLEHFATFDAKNLGSVSRAEFHKGVALLGLSAPSNAIDRLFDMWASPEALLTAPHTTVRDKAAQGAARTSDQLALTDLSGALKRGGAPRHVREAAALHKRIHHDRPIRQAELIPPLPPATEAANLVSADLGILGVKKMDFRASATQHQSVEATASAHDSSESSAIGRLRKAVKRMQVQEKVKEELMSLVGKWSQDKLHLLEGLFQNAEALQMRIETWKQQADPARHRLSAHDAHALFKHLRFSSGADERERLLSTEIIFHDIEESRDVQEGYISLDDLSVTVWQKTNEEIWRMYKDAKLSETVGDGSPGAGASRGGAVVDQLRSALIDQAQRVVALFNSWDKDGDGTITKAEFRRALPELGMWADPEDIDELFDSFDSDGGGSISFRELNRMLRRSRSVDDRKSTKKPSVVLEVADVGALRIEIAKQVRSAAMHAVIDEKLENVPLS